MIKFRNKELLLSDLREILERVVEGEPIAKAIINLYTTFTSDEIRAGLKIFSTRIHTARRSVLWESWLDGHLSASGKTLNDLTLRDLARENDLKGRFEQWYKTRFPEIE